MTAPTATSAGPARATKEGLTRGTKPKLRGVSHEIFFFVSLVTGPLLGLASRTTAEQICTSVYAFSVSAMLATSALFHRRSWSPQGRRRMRRADHSTIFLCIAGTYTAVAGLSLSRGWATLILALVWGGAAVGVALRLLWLDAPKWVVALPYVVVGWIAVVATPELLHVLGGVGFAMMLGGGVCYTLGAVAYARKRPDPWPATFGFHEIFHLFVVVALILHYCLVAFVVLHHPVR